MTSIISSATRNRLALAAFATLWLGACGGGGDTVASAPAPLPAATGTQTSAPAPSAAAPTPAGDTATPVAFRAWGPLVVDTAVTPSSTTSVERLSTGASVVASVKNGALQAQLLDVTGATHYQRAKRGQYRDPNRNAIGARTARLYGRLSDGSFAPEAGSAFSVSGGADGHHVLSYEVSADTSVEVHAQAK